MNLQAWQDAMDDFLKAVVVGGPQPWAVARQQYVGQNQKIDSIYSNMSIRFECVRDDSKPKKPFVVKMLYTVGLFEADGVTPKLFIFTDDNQFWRLHVRHWLEDLYGPPAKGNSSRWNREGKDVELRFRYHADAIQFIMNYQYREVNDFVSEYRVR